MSRYSLLRSRGILVAFLVVGGLLAVGAIAGSAIAGGHEDRPTISGMELAPDGPVEASRTGEALNEAEGRVEARGTATEVTLSFEVEPIEEVGIERVEVDWGDNESETVGGGVGEDVVGFLAVLCSFVPDQIDICDLIPQDDLSEVDAEDEDNVYEFSHVYEDPGTYTVRATVTDEAGAVTFDEARVKVYEPFVVSGPIVLNNETIDSVKAMGDAHPNIGWEEEEERFYVRNVTIPTGSVGIRPALNLLDTIGGLVGLDLNEYRGVAAVEVAGIEESVVVENVFIHPPDQGQECKVDLGDPSEYCAGANVGVLLEGVDDVEIRDVFVDARGRSPFYSGINIRASSNVTVQDSRVVTAGSNPMNFINLQESWAVRVDGEEGNLSTGVELKDLQLEGHSCASGVYVGAKAGNVTLSGSTLQGFEGGGCDFVTFNDDDDPDAMRSLHVENDAEDIYVYDNAFMEDFYNLPGDLGTPTDNTESPLVEGTVLNRSGDEDAEGFNVVGGPFLGGNYWAGKPSDTDGHYYMQDYEGHALPSDGFGNIPFVVGAGVEDPLPLVPWVKPPENVTFDVVSEENASQTVPEAEGVPIVAEPSNNDPIAENLSVDVRGDAELALWHWAYERVDLQNETDQEEVNGDDWETDVTGPTWEHSFSKAGVYDITLEPVVEAIRHNASEWDRRVTASNSTTTRVVVASAPQAVIELEGEGKCQLNETSDRWGCPGSFWVAHESSHDNSNGISWNGVEEIVGRTWTIQNETNGDTVTVSWDEEQDPSSGVTWLAGVTHNHGEPAIDNGTTFGFQDGGDYTIELEVTNRFGLSDTTSRKVNVQTALDPKIDVSPTTVDTLENVAVTEDSDFPEDITVQNRTWGFGDGTIIQCPVDEEWSPGTGYDGHGKCPEGARTASNECVGDCFIDHAYMTSGDYTVWVNITIREGSFNESARVQVDNQAPPAFFQITTEDGQQVIGETGDQTYTPKTRDVLTFQGPASRELACQGDAVDDIDVTACLDDPRGDVDGEIVAWEWTVHRPDEPEPWEWTLCLDPQKANLVCDDEVAGVAVNLSHEEGTNTSFKRELNERGGTYQIKLATIDDDGDRTDTASRTVQVDWTDPELDLSCGWTGQDGQAHACEDGQISATTIDDVTFRVDANVWEIENQVTNILWEVDGKIEDHGVEFEFGFEEKKPHDVTAVAGTSDPAPEGLESRASVKVLIENSPPEPDFAVEPFRQIVGDPVTFTARSVDPDGHIEHIEWSLGGGITDTNETVTHTYEDTGIHEVALTVIDDDGDSASLTRDILLEPPSPTARFQATPKQAPTGHPITFSDESQSSDYGRIVEREWSFGDGNTKTCTQAGPCNATHAYAKSGTYPVKLTATNDQNRQDTASTTINVANQPPIVSANATPNPASIHDVIQFEGQATVPDGTVKAWHWDFDDGTVSNEKNPTHTYDAKGLYEVTVAVTDDIGDTNQTTLNVHVDNQPPTIANLTHTPQTPSTGDEATFLSDAHDSDGFLTAHTWTFGEENQAQGEQTTHTFATPGTHNVTLAVTDDHGDTTETWTHVNVQNRAPTPAFTHTPQAPRALDEVTFLSDAHDSDGDILHHEWRIEGGHQGQGPTTQHTFEAPGTYNVTLNVTDDFGTQNESTQPVTIANAPPAAGFTIHPDTLTTTDTVQLTDRSTAPTGEIIHHAWEFGDGTHATGPEPTHRYDAPGSYVIQLTVTDEHGDNVTTYERVTIQPDTVDVAGEDDPLHPTPAPGVATVIGLALATGLIVHHRRRSA